MANGKRALCNTLRDTLATLDEMNLRGANADMADRTRENLIKTMAKHGCKE